MSARERLESYLDSLRTRLRTHIYGRAAAIALAGVLAITAFTVWTLHQQEFAPAIVVTGFSGSRTGWIARFRFSGWGNSFWIISITWALPYTAMG